MDENQPIELVMYGRSTGCAFQSIAERVLANHQVPYRTIMADTDPDLMQRVVDWTGFQSVPTFVIARPGEDLPIEEPAPLTVSSPRGVDRGTMLTEPSRSELIDWLRKHRLLDAR